ncbi:MULTISPECIES: polysaccharide biosynthesis/export family protein [Sphingobacteriaceae]|uniref:Soluble ligand binding domain n=1 Tax=Sphingobacterium sp. (strain 21) TaxID=743722 RepID=F4CB18_SPHS2
MKTKTNKLQKLKLFAFLITFLVASCSSSKKLKYFQDLPQVKTGTEFNMTKFEEVKIQSDDVLNIRINTVDLEASEAINNGNNVTPGIARNISTSGTNQMITGYMVAHDGTVDIPVLGNIKVAGLTMTEAIAKVRERAEQFFKGATVSMRFANFRMSVLGEVKNPGMFVIPNQRTSVLDAVAFAGDLTMFGKRNNVMLIRRDEQGKAVAVKMDLTSKEIFESPYFYLKQNDVVYVEPAKSKLLNADTASTRYISVLISLISLGIAIWR